MLSGSDLLPKELTEDITFTPKWLTKYAGVIKGLVGILALFVGYLVIQEINKPTTPDALDIEVYRQFLQLALITTVGGYISLIYAGTIRERDARHAKNQYLRDIRDAQRSYLQGFHEKALSSYNRAKKIRRILVAKALETSNGIVNVKYQEYTPLMESLEDVQLEMESLRRQVEVGAHIFEGAEHLQENLSNMEKYLRKVLKEYERSGVTRNGTNVHIADLPRCNEYLFVKNHFVLGFARYYEEIERELFTLINK